MLASLLALLLSAPAACIQDAQTSPLDQRAARIPAHPRDIHTPPLQPFSPPAPMRLRLDRGARLLLIENHELPLIDGSLLFRGGSAEDPVGRAGLAELLADVLREGGSEVTPGTALDDWLDTFGASITIQAEAEALRLDFSCLTQDLDNVLEAIGQLLIIPAYPQAELEKSRKRLLTRLQARRSDPHRQADVATMRAIYGAEAAAARQASEYSISSITREDLLRFHSEHLGVDRLVVGVIGDVQPATLSAQLETLFLRLPVAKASSSLRPTAFLQPAHTRIYLLDRPDAGQSELRIAAPGTRRIDRDFAALSLWSYAVGFGGASNRLTLKLRNELNLISSGSLYFQPGWDRAGRLEAYLTTRNTAVGEALSALQALLREGLAPLPQAEFEMVRDRLRHAQVFQVDRPRKVLARALTLEFHGYAPDFWTQYAERLTGLDTAEVAAAIGRHLDPDRLVIIAVGPAATLAPQLIPLGEVLHISTPEAATASLIERLFEDTGGREVWREARYIELEAEISREGAALTSEHLWQDLTLPRQRVETVQAEASSTLVVSELGAWRSSGEAIATLSQEQRAVLLMSSQRNLFQVLKEIATLELTDLRAVDGSRLEIMAGPLQGTWLQLSDAGHPTRLGYEFAGREQELEFLGWREFDGVYAPAEILSLDGRERRRVHRARWHDELDPALFAQPR